MYTVIDLFAGAGGLSLGFQLTKKFKVVGVIENNDNALETYRKNHDEKNLKIDKDIRTIDFYNYKKQVGEVDVVIGGPPCQGFSNANRQKTKFISMNNSLVKRYADAILALKPKAFVMENVAMLRSDVHKFFDSHIDHKEVVALGLEMKPEIYVIMNKNPDGEEMLNLLNDKSRVEAYSLKENIFNAIKLIHRYISKTGKLNNYYDKYAKIIINALNEYKRCFNNDAIGEIILGYIDIIVDNYVKRRNTDIPLNIIDNFVEFIQAINLMLELYENQIIFNLDGTANEKIIVKINTYTVYNYLKTRLETEYRTIDRVLNAKDYGAPQERRRFVLLGLRKDYNSEIQLEFPKPTCDTVHTVRDAIRDLEDYEPSKSVEDEPRIRIEFSSNPFTLKLQNGADFIANHVNTDTRETALERFRNIMEGKNFHSLSAELKVNTYSDPTRTQNTIYLRLKYDEPCGTVVNVRKSMWIHPTKNRAISIREAARLQTFPDSYIFYGSKDSQYQQVGNAVPPILAQAIADYVLKMIK